MIRRDSVLMVERINPRLNMVTAEAIEQYRRDHLGKRGRPLRNKISAEPG